MEKYASNAKSLGKILTTCGIQTQSTHAIVAIDALVCTLLTKIKVKHKKTHQMTKIVFLTNKKNDFSCLWRFSVTLELSKKIFFPKKLIVFLKHRVRQKPLFENHPDHELLTNTNLL